MAVVVDDDFGIAQWPSFTTPAIENFLNSIAGVVNAGL